MKDIVVAAVALFLGALGPQSYQQSSFDPLWMLGMVVLLAYSFGRLARLLHLPSMVGWICAGLVVGSSGLELVSLQENDTLLLVRQAAVVWVGFQVGLHVWPLSWLDWKRVGVVLGSTLGVWAIVSVSCVLLLGVPWWFALLLGALSCMWEPFTGMPAARRHRAIQVGVVGSAVSLLVMQVELLWLAAVGTLGEDVFPFVGRFFASLLIGALAAGVVRTFSLLPKSVHGLLLGLFVACCASALLFNVVQLHPLPFGFAAGAVLAQGASWRRRLRYILFRIGPMPLLLYFALLGATLNVRVLNAPQSGLLVVLMVSMGALFVLRGIIPALYLRLRGRLQHDLGWELLPRGVLLFELCYAVDFGLLDVLTGPQAILWQQYILSDILISALFYAVLARLAFYLSTRSARK